MLPVFSAVASHFQHKQQVSNSTIPLGSLLFALVFTFGVDSTMGQAFTHADSGWVRIFNGKDFTGLYSRNYTQAIQHPPGAPYQIIYPNTDTACIRVSAGSPQGNIGTDKSSYSHYRMRVEQKFDALNPDFNAGLTYHTDETVNRMLNNWPRSIEFQMQQREPGAAYSIQQVTFTTTVTGGAYAKTGTIVQTCEFGCNGRSYRPNPVIPEGENGKPRWLRFELVARGSDSAIHIVNDTVVMRLWNIRIFNDAQNGTANGPYNHGALGLQSEGSMINYRRWEIMEFPAATPLSSHYLHRFFLDHADSGEVLRAQSVYAIQWRTLGISDLPKVKLEYNTGLGWQSIADSANNTGTYNWTVPNLTTQSLRFRISGPAWAWADSSRGLSSITPSSGIQGQQLRPIRFSIASKGEIFSNVSDFKGMEIVDVFGHVVRTLTIENHDLIWDLNDSKGHRVFPGFYFVSLFTKDQTPVRTLRVLILKSDG